MLIALLVLVIVYSIFKLSTIIFNISFMINIHRTNVSNKWIDNCKNSETCFWFMFVIVILFSIPFYLNIINAYIKSEEISENETEV